MENFDRNIDNITEEEDFGCIVGCALTDTLQEIISSLAGEYAVLYFHEEKSVNPDKKKLSSWTKRSEKIGALRYYFGRDGYSYSDIRRWIAMYSEELKQVDNLRKQYALPA